MTPAPGTRIGPYEILAQVGAGGMGEVYRARDTRLEREVAIKVLPAALSHDSDRLRRFEQEARATSALNHPNILVIYDIGSHDGSPYIVSELLQGETLRERLREGPLTQRKAVEFALQIARALAAAHDRAVVHRDLKPENLFVTRDGVVKILDFGLAKLRQPSSADKTSAPTVAVGTEPGVVMGTAGYMSPEQVRGLDTDARSDLFSFGAILYEMLAGRRAFHGESSVEAMNAILKEEPEPLASPALDRVVRHCLEKRPDERFRSAHDLAFALEAMSTVSTGPIAAIPPRKRRLLPVAIAVALLGAAALAFLAGRRVNTSQMPVFQRLTFRRGNVHSARFDPDGRTIVYSASWDGKMAELFSTRPGTPESRSLGISGADVHSISASGEMALILRRTMLPAPREVRTLAEAPLAGGAPREILNNVYTADWGPDGNMAIVRIAGERNRIEYPAGKLVYETAQNVPAMRVSPDGNRIAFAESSPIYGLNASINVIDRNGKKTQLTSGLVGDRFELAWSGNNEVWFDTRMGGDDTLYAVSLAGKKRMLARLPDALQIFDVSKDGRVLIGRSTLRGGIMGVAPSEERERDFSWLDMSELNDISPDARTLLITEYGKGGGVGRWSVYLRKTDGSPAVRLGEGQAFALSPDGKQAITMTTSPPQLVLLPVGAGEPLKVTSEGVRAYYSATLLPDGKRLVFIGDMAGRGLGCFVQGISETKARPIAQGVEAERLAISPDGKWVALQGSDRRIHLYPVEGGNARSIPGLDAGDFPARWTADGRGLYVFNSSELPAKIYELDLASGQKRPWKQVMPADPAGIIGMYGVIIAADSKSYYYSYQRDLSDLFLVDGLK
jgi:Tol biopolymer transport system component